MSSTSLPIGITQFTSALPSLPLTTLHLKAAELRNSLAHLDYSQEQLHTFPADADCQLAIRENEQVIAKMKERLEALRAEVEGRGASWLEFLSAEEVARALADGRGLEGGMRDGWDEPPSLSERVRNEEIMSGGESGEGLNGENGTNNNPWTDGTFTTGRINGDGEVIMSGMERANVATNGNAGGGGVNGVHDATRGNRSEGREQTHTLNNGISDDEMRARLEARLREDTMDEEEDGMHL